MINIDKYIGIPFKSGGRNYTGCDCYGLIYLFYLNELNIKLPEYYAPAFDSEAVNIIYESQKLNLKFWQEVKHPEPYNLIAIKFNCPYVNHVGIYLGNGQFLHTRERIGSCITRTDSPAWRRLIEAYYAFNNKENIGDI